MTDQTTYDVAIVGYGPVGVTAANLLGQMGLNVVVVERDPNIYSRARAISTDEEVVRIWQQIGLADRLNADMQPGNGANFVDANGVPFVQLLPVIGATATHRSSSSTNPRWRRCCVPGSTASPTSSVLLEHECLRVIQRSDHVELMLADLNVDEFRRIRASYVIAADGASSSIRGQLSVGYSAAAPTASAGSSSTPKCSRNGPAMTGSGSTATRPGPPWTAPPRWVITAGSSRCATRRTTRTCSPRTRSGRCSRDQGITEDNVKILGFACYSHHVRFADRWRVGRVFLAGDAAHAMPPWIGQGMCAGVRDVANLCWKLGAVLRGSLPESVLDSYQAERLPHVKDVTNRAVKTGKLIIQRNRYRAAARNHIFRTASKVPGFTTWLRDTAGCPMRTTARDCWRTTATAPSAG